VVDPSQSVTVWYKMVSVAAVILEILSKMSEIAPILPTLPQKSCKVTENNVIRYTFFNLFVFCKQQKTHHHQPVDNNNAVVSKTNVRTHI